MVSAQYTTPVRNPYAVVYVPAIGRLWQVCYSARPGVPTMGHIADMARAAGISKAATWRLLAQLQADGHITYERIDGANALIICTPQPTEAGQ